MCEVNDEHVNGDEQMNSCCESYGIGFADACDIILNSAEKEQCFFFISWLSAWIILVIRGEHNYL